MYIFLPFGLGATVNTGEEEDNLIRFVEQSLALPGSAINLDHCSDINVADLQIFHFLPVQQIKSRKTLSCQTPDLP